MIINQHNINFESLLNELSKIECCNSLSSSEINKLDYKFKEGLVWEIITDLILNGKNEEVKFYLNIPKEFPFKHPKIFIDKTFYDKFKYLPHIEQNNSICVFDENLNYNIQEGKLFDYFSLLISRAKKNITEGVNNNEFRENEFKREFNAYWEKKYSRSDKVLNIGLTDYNEFPTESTIIKGFKIIDEKSNYNFHLINDSLELEKLKLYYKEIGIKTEEVSFFFIKNPFDYIPPFELKVKDSLNLLNENLNIRKEFKKSINKEFTNVVVVFGVRIKNQVQFYGWVYPNISNGNNGGYRTYKYFDLINNPLTGSKRVIRICFDNINTKRLQKRTTGYVEGSKSVAITGLGSIGSNLLYYLNNLRLNKIHLIDNEVLTASNINRHFLGFSELKKFKSEQLYLRLKKDFPLREIGYKTDDFVKVVNEDEAFINDCDFHFFVVGIVALENFLLDNLKEGKLTKPTFIIFVEPYLAGGHLIFFNPSKVDTVAIIINDFKNYIIRKTDDVLDKTYLVEGGCQSGYSPYSSSNITLFLSAIFPFIHKVIIQNYNKSSIVSWVGDKKLILNKEIELSEFGNENNSYTLIEEII